MLASMLHEVSEPNMGFIQTLFVSLYVPVWDVPCVSVSINHFNLPSTEQLGMKYHTNPLGSANQVSPSNLAFVVWPTQSSGTHRGGVPERDLLLMQKPLECWVQTWCHSFTLKDTLMCFKKKCKI